MGLYHIAKAVGFLNNDCQLVRAAGLLCWRLSGLQACGQAVWLGRGAGSDCALLAGESLPALPAHGLHAGFACITHTWPTV